MLVHFCFIVSMKGKILIESLMIEGLNHLEEFKEVYDDPAKKLEAILLRGEDLTNVIQIKMMLTPDL